MIRTCVQKVNITAELCTYILPMLGFFNIFFFGGGGDLTCSESGIWLNPAGSITWCDLRWCFFLRRSQHWGRIGSISRLGRLWTLRKCYIPGTTGLLHHKWRWEPCLGTYHANWHFWASVRKQGSSVANPWPYLWRSDPDPDHAILSVTFKMATKIFFF